MKKLVYSIKYAFQGICYLVLTQRNARFHLVSSTIAICLGFLLKLSNIEWAIVTLCIGGVISAEAFNTAIEKICDTFHPEIHPKIKIIKDLAAAGVLILGLGALVIGLIIYLPKLINFFQ